MFKRAAIHHQGLQVAESSDCWVNIGDKGRLNMQCDEVGQSADLSWEKAGVLLLNCLPVIFAIRQLKILELSKASDAAEHI